MFGSLFRVAFRILFRDKISTLTNIFGLAIGLAVSLIIFIYVNGELTHDRFHEHADRIYRVGVKGKVADNDFNHAVTSPQLAPALKSEVPGIEETLRVARFGSWLISNGETRYNEDGILFADSAFFSLFSYPLIAGDPNEVLRHPKSIVLSRSSAEKYFGGTNPVGQMLRIENDTIYYKVTGVMENIPYYSHLRFDMIASLNTFSKMMSHHNWTANYLYTYYLKSRGASDSQIQSGLDSLVKKYVFPSYSRMIGLSKGQAGDPDDWYSFVTINVADIHLRSGFTAELEPTGNILYVYLFTALASVILILSCMNFISLVTARSAYRSKEVGIRKLAGSERHILVRQFLIESSLLAFFAMAMALFLAELALPQFNRYIGTDLSLGQLLNKGGVILILLLMLFIGVISGLVPALQLARISPSGVLRRMPQHKEPVSYTRTTLVIIQLFIAIGVVILSLFIGLQFRFLVKKDLGFDKNSLIVIRRSDGLKDSLQVFKQKVLSFQGVESISNTTHLPGDLFPRNPYVLEGVDFADNLIATTWMTSYGLDSVFALKMIQGRFFNQTFAGDSVACVINESAARALNLVDPVGKTILRLTDKPDFRPAYQVIGLVRDFHFELLDKPIEPLVMILMPGNFEGYLTLRVKPETPEPTFSAIRKTWEMMAADYPFVAFDFGQYLGEKYSPVKETQRIFIILAIIAVLITGIGLFSLVSYSQFNRSHEIGIRKALGANTNGILIFEISRVLKLIGLSSALAWAGSYLLLKKWLSEYAYRIELNLLLFIPATIAVALLVIVLLIIQSQWAARQKPGMLLRYE